MSEVGFLGDPFPKLGFHSMSHRRHQAFTICSIIFVYFMFVLLWIPKPTPCVIAVPSLNNSANAGCTLSMLFTIMILPMIYK